MSIKIKDIKSVDIKNRALECAEVYAGKKGSSTEKADLENSSLGDAFQWIETREGDYFWAYVSTENTDNADRLVSILIKAIND